MKHQVNGRSKANQWQQEEKENEKEKEKSKFKNHLKFVFSQRPFF